MRRVSIVFIRNSSDLSSSELPCRSDASPKEVFSDDCHTELKQTFGDGFPSQETAPECTRKIHRGASG